MSNNDLQQIHQQRLKSQLQPTEALNNENNILLQNVAYNEGISQMQHHHYLQQQQHQPRHRLIHGELHRQTNMPINSTSGTKNVMLSIYI